MMLQKKLSVAALVCGAMASGSSIAADAQNGGYKVDLDLRTFYMDRDFGQGLNAEILWDTPGRNI